MAFYCWACYGRNDAGSGPCAHCGREISPPPAVREVDRLEWGTRHPDPDIGVIAARRLGQLGQVSELPFLRELIRRPPDPYVGAEALRSVLRLSSVDGERDLLVELAREGAAPVRRVAREALEKH